MNLLNQVAEKSLNHLVMSREQSYEFFRERRIVRNELSEIVLQGANFDSFATGYLLTLKQSMANRTFFSLQELKKRASFVSQLNQSSEYSDRLKTLNEKADYLFYMEFVNSFNKFSSIGDGGDQKIAYLQDHKDETLEKNSKLVYTFARRYRFMQMDIDDLFQEGNMGVITAWSKYDERIGSKFSDYCVHWIKQKIKSAIAKQGSSIGLRDQYYKDSIKLRNAIADFIFENNCYPSADLLSERLEVSKDKILHLLEIGIEPLRLNSLTASEQEIIDTLKDQNIDEYEEILPLDKILNEVLKPREAQIIRKYYGFESEPQSLEKIGKDYDLTRERIRQIRDHALNKLRNPKYARILAQYL